MSTKALDFAIEQIGEEKSAWREHNLEFATQAFGSLNADDWRQLRQLVLSKPAFWQERCAEAIGDIESDEAISTLVVVLASQHMQAAAIAASQLSDVGVKLPSKLRPQLLEIKNYLVEERNSRSADVEKLLRALS